MIVDLLLAPIVSIVRSMMELLPDGEPLDLPALTGMQSLLAQLNSVVPIGPAIAMAIVLLSALVVFLAIRLVLTVWSLIWP